MLVCVSERERDGVCVREQQRDSERERERERERESVCVHVIERRRGVSVCERVRER